jgi:hypothetical protein
MDFFDALVYLFFKQITDVVFISESVGACRDSEFASDYTGNLSALPAFGVVE